MNFSTCRQDWLSNVKNDLLAGLVVALALIPEAIAFSIIAGVDPKVGLYAAFCIATVSAFVGGRPGMISAATGAMALLMVTLVKDHGLQYLLAATVLTGLLQIVAGWLRLGELMRFVSRSVITGFVNALAILIFMAQLPELTHVSWHVYAMVAAGLGIIYLFPYITKAVPSPLVTIVVLTAVSMWLGLDIRTVGDMGQLPDSLPFFFWPEVPLTLETLKIIFPVAATLATVGLLESMMTASIVDDLTDTSSNKNRECVGQGVANITAGFLGGMAGCAMIGQSVINIKSGGRGRLSTLVAGVFLLLMVVFLGNWVARIPMAALVAVMIMVSIGTFSWTSLSNLRVHPKSTSLVMMATVVTVVATHDLAKGVLVGVLLSGFFFAHKVGQILRVRSSNEDQGRLRAYAVTGQVFFASAERFVNAFDYKEVIEKVRIDVSRAHFWDITAVSALDKVVLKFRREGTEVEVIGLNAASATMVDKFAVHDKDGAEDLLMGH
ncbi:MAG: SulP family inorganic anion transporter [Rhodoferax sp.]|nr:SulP family inorganic anion transporter [Betaproteobacteria bacterium]NCN98262.1 SulP family inorganic anion transporter [Rhodoferax sp.]OIP20899.1 MAG: sodium-independent anion transporter [Comamonadaceae bacterium CG2_30_57_122]PIZ23800.1 MAG: sodium-independent anion transporter [Comamonadaceae bacterium CG_4_10_14_0_8_um_filter_57_29]PJC14370.1 MAG: sodium-independent anion transporter [Comamonadaceae bacterium CG_4_9_14_0_8_um_filter_57_21]